MLQQGEGELIEKEMLHGDGTRDNINHCSMMKKTTSTAMICDPLRENVHFRAKIGIALRVPLESALCALYDDANPAFVALSCHAL